MKKNKTTEKEVPVLVVFKGNYADEFDVEGFTITTKRDWEEHLKVVEKMFELKGKDSSFEKFFGTNEAIAFDNFKHYSKSFEVIPVLDKAVLTFFNKYFRTGFGHFLYIDEDEALDMGLTDEQIQELAGKPAKKISGTVFDNLKMWRKD